MCTPWPPTGLACIIGRAPALATEWPRITAMDHVCMCSCSCSCAVVISGS